MHQKTAKCGVPKRVLEHLPSIDPHASIPVKTRLDGAEMVESEQDFGRAGHARKPVDVQKICALALWRGFCTENLYIGGFCTDFLYKTPSRGPMHRFSVHRRVFERALRGRNPALISPIRADRGGF